MELGCQVSFPLIRRSDVSKITDCCNSFGIDGLPCIWESSIKLLVTLAFLLWNFVWLWDLVQLFKRPMYTRGKQTWLKRLIFYVIAAAGSLIFGVIDSVVEIYGMV